uniref:Putative secreted protein n=1 Tax=Panstrongylus lignarius TaxID=156445 RepID=A0A224XYE8_9HEMI
MLTLPINTFLSLFFFRSASLYKLMLITLTVGRLKKSKCSPQKHISPFCLHDVLAYSVLSRQSSQKYLFLLAIPLASSNQIFNELSVRLWCSWSG